jgi:hypothetical protein
METANGERILFCNVGWMERYEGQFKGGDEIKGGGRYVQQKGRGHEVCNFSPVRGKLYGYVQPAGKEINLERVGGSLVDDEVTGVTVVWTAKRPGGSTVVIGWYRNATVFRKMRRQNNPSPRHCMNHINQYRIVALAKDCVLLPIDARTCEIPRQVKGSMGQANVWYADDPRSVKIVDSVLHLIAGKRTVKRTKPARAVKQDQERKAQVEKAAIRACCDHFEKLGYVVRSVERDNVGWDLEANLGKTKLLIEVKGLSGAGPSVELTPNEFKVFSERLPSYRLGIVIEALTSPSLRVCRYSEEQGAWIVDKDSSGKIDVITKQSATIKIV